LIHRQVNDNEIEFLPNGRRASQLVGSLRAGDKDVTLSKVPREPRRAHVPLLKLRRAADDAGNQRLRRGQHKKPIDHAGKSKAPHMEPRPLERGRYPPPLRHSHSEEMLPRSFGRAFSRKGKLFNRGRRRSLPNRIQNLNRPGDVPGILRFPGLRADDAILQFHRAPLFLNV